jgi:hypothetical protein
MLCLAAAQALVAVDTTSAATEPSNWFGEYADQDYQVGRFMPMAFT